MPRVLIADDDQNLPSLLGILLEKEGHEVTLASSGGETIKHLTTSGFDLIILDWDMPDVPGVRICKGYRDRGGQAAVIMLTGRKEVSDKEAAFAAGADDYLTKPFSPKELLARMGAVLRRTSPCGPVPLATSQGRRHNAPDPRLHPSLLPEHVPEPAAPARASGSGSPPAPALVQQRRLDHAQTPSPRTAAAPAASKNLVGEVFSGRYKIVERVGEGGMGEIYKGVHTTLDRPVAIKVVKASLTRDETTAQRFHREAKALSMIEHPNLVTVHDFGTTDDNESYLVMEFLQGDTLDVLISRRGHIPWMEAREIFGCVCDGLAAAHDEGLIHRDLKPSNVMLVERHGRRVVKVLDMGLAKFMQEKEKGQPKLTQAGEIFGSPLYMSPEQCMGEPLDSRADIYSMGCLMYETLSGRPPFFSTSFVAATLMQVKEEAPGFRDTHPDVPEELEALVLKCLRKPPDQRPQSMLELKDNLFAISRPQPDDNRHAQSGPAPSGTPDAERAQDQATAPPSNLLDNLRAGLPGLRPRKREQTGKD